MNYQSKIFIEKIYSYNFFSIFIFYLYLYYFKFLKNICDKNYLLYFDT